MDYKEKKLNCFCCYPEDWQYDNETETNNSEKNHNASWNECGYEKDNGYNDERLSNYGNCSQNNTNFNKLQFDDDNKYCNRNSNHNCNCNCNSHKEKEDYGNRRRHNFGCCFCNLFRFRCK